jgi:putative flippase GtrA
VNRSNPIASVIGIWSGNHLQFVRFLIAGGLSVPFNLTTRVLLTRVVGYKLSIVGAQLVGMAVAYALSRRFVFRPSGHSVPHELSRFLVVNLLSLLQTLTVALLLLRLFKSANMNFYPEFVAHFLGLATSAGTAFLAHKKLSFAPRGVGL